MKRNVLSILSAILLIATLLAGSDSAFARPPVQAGAPTMISYQGQVTVNGEPYNGTGYFKFAVVDAGGTSYWTNDGTTGGEPSAAVTLPVTNGLFTVLLGDAGMEPLPASAFAGPERYLRVWFKGDGATFARLTPDQRIAAVPYALQAAQVANSSSQPANCCVYRLSCSGTSPVSGDFAQVGGIGSENEVVGHKVIGPGGEEIIQKTAGQLKWTDVTLWRGLSADRSLWDWRQRVVQGEVVTARCDCTITMLDAEQHEIAKWELVRAWPARLAGPILPTDLDQAPIEEIVLTHEGVVRVK